LTTVILVFCVVAVFAARASGEAIGKGGDIAAGTTGNAVYFGRYQQADLNESNPPVTGDEGVDWISAPDAKDSDTTHYYAIQPIKWRVLSNAGGKLFLLSEKNLDARPYNDTYTSVTWETSTIRAWLNGTVGGNFLHDAFTLQERPVIAYTSVANDDNPTYHTSGGEPTTDKIFFLSISEAMNPLYGFADNTGADASRESPNTAYAASRDSAMYGENVPDYWWLRSPGYYDIYAAFVGDGGSVDVIGDSVAYSAVGVRAAFNLNLSSLIFTSAAAGGKSIPSNLPSLTNNTSPAINSALKLTVLDTSQTLEVTATDAQSTQSVNLPGDLGFSYTNAATGANQYVSCILEDGGGAIKYYGKLADSSSAASGALSVPLPALSDGTYKLSIFSEQANGDYCTDYAGNPTTMTLTVSGFGATAAVSDFTSGTANIGGAPNGNGGGGCSAGALSLAGFAALALVGFEGKRRGR
jgi:hypothetical protein